MKGNALKRRLGMQFSLPGGKTDLSTVITKSKPRKCSSEAVIKDCSLAVNSGSPPAPDFSQPTAQQPPGPSTAPAAGSAKGVLCTARKMGFLAVHNTPSRLKKMTRLVHRSAVVQPAVRGSPMVFRRISYGGCHYFSQHKMAEKKITNYRHDS